MEKIRSIDHDGSSIAASRNREDSQRNDTFIDIKGANNSQLLEKWKESLSSNEVGSAPQLQWNSDIIKLNRQPE